MCWRLQGSRGEAALWRPLTLHWRRASRLRAAGRGNTPAGSWTSIFAPRIVLHVSSSLSAVVSPTSFATVRSIHQTWLRQHDRILQHRATLREHNSHERLAVSRPREFYGNSSRADFLRLARPQRSVDAIRHPGSSPQLRPVRAVSVTPPSTTLTTRIANSFANHRHHSASSFILGASTAYLRERTPRPSAQPTEPARILHHTELIWRQPPAAAKAETHAFRPNVFETSQRSRTAALESTNAHERPTTTAARPATPAFDAAQMDRFVDNVIQRVEKRVRIERERRGW
jgi:hypothetical protein